MLTSKTSPTTTISKMIPFLLTMVLTLLSGTVSAATVKECIGSGSCEDMIIEGYDEVLCDGYDSCQGAQIKGASLVTCKSGGCLDVVFSDVTKVDCDGSNSCYRAVFEDYTGVLELYCHGAHSCQDARVLGPANIICEDPRACHYMVGIEGGTVTCTNYWSCAYMSSTSPDCVTCGTGSSCLLLGLFGEPKVWGSEYDDASLSAAGTYCKPTESPTTSPTGSPTKSPTTSPTTSPTESPTESPTTSPTESPTSSPTDSPTSSLSYCEQPCGAGSCNANQVQVCGKNGKTGCIAASAYASQCETVGTTCGACQGSLRRGDGPF